MIYGLLNLNWFNLFISVRMDKKSMVLINLINNEKKKIRLRIFLKIAFSFWQYLSNEVVDWFL